MSATEPHNRKVVAPDPRHAAPLPSCIRTTKPASNYTCSYWLACYASAPVSARPTVPLALPTQSSLPVTAPLSAPSKKKTNVQATSQAASLTFFTTKVAHLNAGIHSSSTKALFVHATVFPTSRCFCFGKTSHSFFEDFCSYAVPFVAVSQAALSFAFATPSAPHSAFFRASDSCCGAITLGTTSHADACSIVTISSKILALYEKSVAKFSASFDDTPLPPKCSL